MVRNNKLFIVLTFILISIIFFYKLIFSGYYLINEDNKDLFFPFKNISYKIIKDNEFPLWDRYRYSGNSFLSEVQSQTFYPVYYIFNFLPPETALNYLTVLHLAMAGFFMFIYLNYLVKDTLISFFGGIIFMFSGIFGQSLKDANYVLISTLAWVPLILLYFTKTLREEKLSNLSFTSIFCSFQFFAGHLQFVFYTHILMLFYFTNNIITTKFEKIIKKILKYLAVLFIMFLIISIQFFPALHLSRKSARGTEPSYNFATGLSLKPDLLLTSVFVDLFGDRENFFFGPSTTFYMGYTGTAVLILSLYFFICSRDNRKFFLLLIIFSIFCALGRFNPLYKYIFKIPGFNIFRAPQRIIMISSFILLLSAVMGIKIFISNRKFRNSFFLIPLIVLLFIIIFNIFPQTTKSAILKTYKIIYNHGFRSQWLNYFVKNGLPENTIKIISLSLSKFTFFSFITILFLKLFSKQKINKKILILSITFFTAADLWLVDIKLLNFSIIKHKDITKNSSIAQAIIDEHDKCPFRINAGFNLQYSWTTYYGFEDIYGRTAVVPADYIEYLGYIDRYRNFSKLLNIKYKVINRSNNYQKKYFIKLYENGQYALLKYNDFLKRYFMVYNWKYLESKKTIYNELKNNEFDVARTVLLLKKDKVYLNDMESGTKSGYNIKLISDSNNSILLDISTKKKGLLFCCDKFEKGWKCFINGRETPVIRGNYLFRAVVIPEGNSKVLFKYRPAELSYGLFLSITGLLISVFLILYEIKF